LPKKHTFAFGLEPRRCLKATFIATVVNTPGHINLF